MSLGRQGSWLTMIWLGALASVILTIGLSGWLASLSAPIDWRQIELEAIVSQRSSSRDLVIFYNIYVAADQESMRKTLAIVEEQATMIFESAMAHRVQALHYVTIGQEIPDQINKALEPLCLRGIRCEHLRHYAAGFEEVTLVEVLDFCQREENVDQKVLYMHTKGSFNSHYGWSQDTWRRNMMHAVSHSDCLNPQCSVCGLRVLPFPNIHYSGNFWISQCSYVRHLLPPADFAKRFDEMRAEVDNNCRFDFTMRMSPNLPDVGFQTDRFNSEYWITSHPSLVACEMLPDGLPHKHRALQPSQLVLSQFPPHDTNTTFELMDVNRPIYQQVMADPLLRLRQYWHLPGTLFKWLRLYGEGPPPQSWVWGFYPDGAFWKAALDRYGKKAVTTVLDQLVKDNGIACIVE